MKYFRPDHQIQSRFDRVCRKVTQCYANIQGTRCLRRQNYWYSAGYEWSRQANNIIVKYGFDDRIPDPRCGYPPEYRYPKIGESTRNECRAKRIEPTRKTK